jgi:hypothetical protein
MPTKKKRTRSRTRRKTPWTGWAKIQPSQAERKRQQKRCKPKGKCFLGPRTTFPVCKRGTCKVSKKGAWAAYIRARQWGGPKKSYTRRAHPRRSRGTYRRVAKKALNIIYSRK